MKYPFKPFAIFNWAVCHFIVNFWEFFIYFASKPSSDVCFANIFSQAVACLFISLKVTSKVQKYLILMN